MLTVGSLFSGIGGLELGLERAGMVVKWQVENDPYCVRVLEKHWPNVRRHDDISTFLTWTGTSSWDVDLICGGFPCQPVSVAGKQQGDADARWLWPEMRRVCEVVRPRWVLAENVPGLLSASSGRLFGEVVRDLAALGCVVEWFCLSAANVGANHIRDRVWILAHAPGSRCGEGRPQEGGSFRDGTRGSESERRGGDVAHADQPGPQGHGRSSERGRELLAGQGGQTLGSHWVVEPNVGRVAHGVPKRVDRLRGLGNAVVPQVAEYIGRNIINALKETRP